MTTPQTLSPAVALPRKMDRLWRIKRQYPLYVMLIPAAVGLVLFSYLPMGGLVMVFQQYKPLFGFTKSPFVGLANFRKLFALPVFWTLIRNTMMIAIGKIVLGQVISLSFGLLLHEVTVHWFKRTVQTITYAMHFLSWILFGGILLDMLGANGLINSMLGFLRIPPVRFLTEPKTFVWTVIGTDVWKGFGMGAVIYLAALADVDPTLYEAAAVDGAGRWQRLIHVTLPGIASTVVVLACLNLGNVLNAGFEQLLVLSNSAVYSTGDIIDTWVYRMGLVQAQYSLAATVGLFKSVVGMVLIVLSYYLAYRLADYRIF